MRARKSHWIGVNVREKPEKRGDRSLKSRQTCDRRAGLMLSRFTRSAWRGTLEVERIGFRESFVRPGGQTAHVPTCINIRELSMLARIENLLAAEPKVCEAPDLPEAPPLAAAIEVRDLPFSYSGERWNLEGVSLGIPRGSFGAFVGGSGAEKYLAHSHPDL